MVKTGISCASGEEVDCLVRGDVCMGCVVPCRRGACCAELDQKQTEETRAARRRAGVSTHGEHADDEVVSAWYVQGLCNRMGRDLGRAM